MQRHQTVRIFSLATLFVAAPWWAGCSFDVGGLSGTVNNNNGGAECGDGVIEESEACDDLNTAPDDGCSPTCQLEEGWECSQEPSVCVPTCGDGLVRGDEQALEVLVHGEQAALLLALARDDRPQRPSVVGELARPAIEGFLIAAFFV